MSASLEPSLRSNFVPPRLPSDALRDVYEQRAELQYAAPVAQPDPSSDRKFERISQTLAERLPCRSFLDVGCGDGRYFHVLADVQPLPGRIAGTDISKRILETALLTAGQAGLRPELVRANAESLPFAAGSFELVLCTQLLEHLLDPVTGLRELARVLEPGGTLVLSTDHGDNRVTRALFAPRVAAVGLLRLTGRRAKVSFPERRFDLDELERLVAAAGLAIERLETFRFSPPPPFGPRTRRLLNRIEKRMSPHRWGDILLVVARKS